MVKYEIWRPPVSIANRGLRESLFMLTCFMAAESRMVAFVKACILLLSSMLTVEKACHVPLEGQYLEYRKTNQLHRISQTI